MTEAIYIETNIAVKELQISVSGVLRYLGVSSSSYETNDNILTINANDNCDGTGRIVTSSQKYEIITRDDQSLILRIWSSDSLSYRDASPAPQPDIKNN